VSLERLRFVLVQSGEPISADALDPKRCGSVMLNSAEAEVLQLMNRLLEVQTGGEQQFSLLADAARFGSNADSDFAPIKRQSAGPLNGHVLLVEDNPVNRAVALKVVGKIGVSAEWAENGQEALEKMAAGRCDLVLMDCQMPVMDGYISTRTRRTLEDEAKLARLPIIAMTANAMVGDRERCLAAGMDDYLTKPLNLQLLEEIMRKWMPAHAKTRPEFAQAPLFQSPAMAEGAQAQNAAPNAATSPAAALVTSKPISVAGGMELLPGMHLQDDPMAALFDAVAANEPAAAATPQVLRSASIPAPPSLPQAPTPGLAPVMAPVTASIASAPKKPAIERAIFDELLDIMGSEFAALVKVYLEDTPKNLRILAQSSQQGDVAGMVAPAHSLKSTSANLGAMALSDIAKKIETMARTSTLSDPISMAKQAIAEFERAAAELKALIGA
jgi:CheY-like chemotaxis protein/HPt (histidine-containing phosphotransfer) domain-containing protein